MEEIYIEIPTKDESISVHGTMRGDYTNPVIVLAPGLGGWMHDLQMFNAAQAMEQAGYSSLRVSFYGHADNQRNISDYDAHDCAKDIDSVVKYLRDHGVKFIAVAGHSYSGLGIMYTEEQNFDTGILWDSTHTDGYEDPESQKNLERDFILNEELNSYISGQGPGYVLSKKVFTEYGPGSAVAAKKFTKPLLVINRSDTDFQVERGLDYINNCRMKKKHVIIPESSHSFTEKGALDKLYQATVDWMNELRNSEELSD